MFDRKSFLSVNFQIPEPNNNEMLVISGCNIFTKYRLYSEFEELTYYCLNDNDSFGCIDIEIFFNNNFNYAYFQFWLNCITIRVNNNSPIKIDMCPKQTCYSKVTKEGYISIGMTYFFKSKEESDYLLNSNCIAIEGLIAINKKTNVYGFNLEFEKITNGKCLLETLIKFIKM